MKLISAFTMAATMAFSFAIAASAETHTKGYFRKSGTYVQPHYNSSSNYTKRDNWSHSGNINPHTGSIGTKSCGVSCYNYRRR